MVETIIRRARRAEAPQLGELAFRSKAWWGYGEDFMAACRQELSVDPDEVSDPDSVFHVAETGGEVVGFYSLVDPARGEIELGALFVEPGWIGRGVGRALMQHAKKTASGLGYRGLVIQGDPNAAAFYRAAGGILIGERESESVRGRQLPLFRVPLAKPEDSR